MKTFYHFFDSFRFSHIILIIFFSLFIYNCGKDDGQLPVVTTIDVTDIEGYLATGGGFVTSDGGSEITARGVCWSNFRNPSISDNKTIDGKGSGSFTSNLTLTGPGLEYHVRAYATNKNGTAYGAEKTFFTPSVFHTATDIEGNIYNTVVLGQQEWFMDNLKTKKFANGDDIATTNPATYDISGEAEPKYQWAYQGNESNVPNYGRLYTFYIVTDTRNVCPTGWHVPSADEWDILSNNLGGAMVAGGKMKQQGTVLWNDPNTEATNVSNFTAVPSGDRGALSNDFNYLGFAAEWWTNSEYNTEQAWYRTIFANSASLAFAHDRKKSGFAVRCVKD